MNRFLILLLCLITSKLSSQNNVVLVDSKNLEPILFASLSSNTDLLWFNEKGSINKKLLNDKNYTISCIGFKSQFIENIKELDTVFLERTDIELEEVVIRGVSLPIESGYHKLKTNSFQNGFTGGIFGVKIEGPNPINKLEEVIFNFRKLEKGYKIELYLFEDSNGEDSSSALIPGKLIYKDEIEFYSSKRKVNVDLRDKEIYFGKSIIVAFQRVNVQKGNEKEYFIEKLGGLNITYQYEETNSYFFHNNRWLIFEGPDGKAWNYQIGIKSK